MRDIHGGLSAHRPIWLGNTFCHWNGHFGQGIANVDLATHDVIGTPIQRQGFGQASDGVFGAGIGGRAGRGACAEIDPLLMIRPP